MPHDDAVGGPSEISTYDLLKDTDLEAAEATEIEKTDKPAEIEEEDKSDSIPESDDDEIAITEPEDKEIDITDDDDVKLVIPFKLKDLQKDFPELLKPGSKYSYIKTALTRDQQFTQIFGTVADAKEASDKSEALDKYEAHLFNGDITPFLAVVKANDDEAFKKLIDNLLPALSKVDSNAYFHILSNVIKNTIISMLQEAQSTKNEELQMSANLLHQLIFGHSNFTPPSKLSTEREGDDKEKIKLHAERMEFVKEQFESRKDEVNHRIDNALKATVENHIDPDGAMTDYVKKNAIRDALDHLDYVIHQDTNFIKILDKLWERAFKARFAQQNVEDIRKAYLSKAKTLLPAVIKKAKNDALRGLGKRKNDADDEETDRKPVERTTRVTSDSNRDKPRGRHEMKPGESTRDFLMRD